MTIEVLTLSLQSSGGTKGEGVMGEARVAVLVPPATASFPPVLLDGGTARRIRTVRGVGYCFEADDAPKSAASPGGGA